MIEDETNKLASNLRNDTQFGTGRLCVGEHRNLLHLLSRLTLRRERDGHIALTTRGYTLTGKISNGASAGSLAATDNQIGITSIAEMEAIRNTLMRGKTPKVMLIAVERQLWHGNRIIVPISCIGILDERCIYPTVRIAAPHGGTQHHYRN